MLYRACFNRPTPLDKVTPHPSVTTTPQMPQDLVAAQSFCGVVLLVMVLTSGFTIVKGSIPAWWIWAVS